MDRNKVCTPSIKNLTEVDFKQSYSDIKLKVHDLPYEPHYTDTEVKLRSGEDKSYHTDEAKIVKGKKPNINTDNEVNSMQSNSIRYKTSNEGKKISNSPKDPHYTDQVVGMGNNGPLTHNEEVDKLKSSINLTARTSVKDISANESENSYNESQVKLKYPKIEQSQSDEIEKIQSGRVPFCNSITKNITSNSTY